LLSCFLSNHDYPERSAAADRPAAQQLLPMIHLDTAVSVDKSAGKPLHSGFVG